MPISAREKIELDKLLDKEKQEHARLSHEAFIQYTWTKRARKKNGELEDPFLVGFHTRRICDRIDQAFADFRNGISTNLLIAVHPRAGKSDIVSRYLAPHFLGEFPNREVIQCSYATELATGFSANARDIVRSDEYKRLYPGVHLSEETNKKNKWVLVNDEGQNTGGGLLAAGLMAGLTGNGAALLVLDDYFKGRKEAESLVFRDSTWNAFRDDFLTRKAPVYICIIIATQWHVDDINGRVKKEMARNKEFPQFEILSFPARARDYKGPGKYEHEFLFQERMGKAYYLEQYATLGKYSAAALFDCNPKPREGGRFNLDNLVYEYLTSDKEHAPGNTFPQVHEKQFVRVWDLAHSAKQRSGDDPDYTSGTLVRIERRTGDPIPHIFIANVERIRENATKRDAFIKRVLEKDGTHVRAAVERSLDSKDAYEYLKKALPQFSFSQVSISSGDKSVRATPLEPIFEAPGHVHVLLTGNEKQDAWIEDWIEELSNFDGSGKQHDDQVDNLSAAYIYFDNTHTVPAAASKALAERRKTRKAGVFSGR
jgi:predicted phage terminase large subunit-like protein